MDKLGLQDSNEVLMTELFYERMQRKESKVLLYKCKPKAIRDLNKKFANEMLLFGRILLQLGKQNLNEFKASPDFASARGLVLWPERKIFGQDFDAYVIYDESDRIKQLYVLAYHIERFFYRANWGDQVKYQDAARNLSVALSGNDCSLELYYFEIDAYFG